MLNENDAIRIDRKKDGTRLFVHLCKCCGKEMRNLGAALGRRTGFCNKCVKHNNIKPYQRAYNSLRTKAIKYNQKLELSFDEFLLLTEVGCCYYCGSKINWKPYGASAYNLDRKDNSKDYTFDNVAVCCSKCNFLKSNFYTSEEFKAVMKVHEIWLKGSDRNREELMSYLLSWQDEINIIL